jgi:SAM-dependent methyltransferase
MIVAAVRRQAAYAEEAGLYEARSRLFHHWRQRLVDLLPVQQGQVVLDVGCGTGLCFALLQERIGPSGTIIGIEPAPRMRERAHRRVVDQGWRNVVLIGAPAETARIPHLADHAVFCAVHDVLRSPQAVRNVLAHVRPGGWVAAVGGKWAPAWAIGLNALVAATHAPFVRDFTGFDRPWAELAQQVTDLRVQEIEMGCGFLAVARTPAEPAPAEDGARHHTDGR